MVEDLLVLLAQALSRDVSHSRAIQQEPVVHKIEPLSVEFNEFLGRFHERHNSPS